jgi:hypothetical protein
MEVVNARGEIQRIIDPSQFTHLGVLGVVTSITMRCLPMFYLKQVCSVFPGLDTFDSLRLGAFKQLAGHDDFYATMIRINLVDKKHHPLRCYIEQWPGTRMIAILNSLFSAHLCLKIPQGRSRLFSQDPITMFYPIT